MNKPSFTLNQSQLKYIAVVCMFIDHVGYTFANRMPHSLYMTMRCIGRTAFPIFAFMLVEGFFHTKNLKKHFILLLIFSVLSELPFDLMISRKPFSLEYQNVMITLLLGLAGMTIMTRFPTTLRFTALIFPVIAELIHTDYGAVGVLTIYLFYLEAISRPEGLKHPEATGLLISLLPLFVHAVSVWRTEYACLLSVPLLCLYNGQKGAQGKGGKYFFYFFYPAHLLLLGMSFQLLTSGHLWPQQ